ncbi:unnamed protein product [Caenorhabditis angaria]|uniref:DUF7087 domain-containing protein n=1 Tax=Caenorhabditis angaria TaxID=860376 RepID=A0A9P1MZJ1_9PELO|nr:unnamed protein product [Caenorhabditis angaria]
MDQIPPYEFQKYVFAARAAVVGCSSFELLLILFGSLGDSGFLSKLIYFLVLGASAAVSAHNIALNVDGRDEIKRALSSTENEVRGKSAALVLVPPFAGVFVFLCVSGHAFFSLFVLIHVLASVGQLGIEAYEVIKYGNLEPKIAIVPPADKAQKAATYDPNYQTLNQVNDNVFTK